MELKEWRQAAPALDRVFALAPDDKDNAGLFSHYGVHLKQVGREGEARVQFQRALSLDRSNPYANHFLHVLEGRAPSEAMMLDYATRL